MNRLRAAVLTGLTTLAVLLGSTMAQAAPSSVVDVSHSAPMLITVNSQFSTVSFPEIPRQTDPGPAINPDEKKQADAQQKQNKIIAGVLAAVLLGLVIWGRRSRKKRSGG